MASKRGSKSGARPIDFPHAGRLCVRPGDVVLLTCRRRRARRVPRRASGMRFERGDWMKALTVKAPWAQLIVRGVSAVPLKLGAEYGSYKDVENRTWSTGHLGRVLIHCGLEPDAAAMQMFDVPAGGMDDDLGRVIGHVSLRMCKTRSAGDGGAEYSAWHQCGLVGWYLRNPVEFAFPFAVRGRQGLWDLPVHVADAAGAWSVCFCGFRECSVDPVALCRGCGARMRFERGDQ